MGCYIRTPSNYEFFGDEEYEDLYGDVNVNLKDAEHEEGKGDKTDGSEQSSSVSSDFATQFLNLDNVSPVDTKVTSLMKIKGHNEEPSSQTFSLLTVPTASATPKTTIPPSIPSVTLLPQQSTPTPTPTTKPTTTSIPHALLDFSSLFGFDKRVFALEKELFQIKQVDHCAEILASIKSQISAMMDDHLSTRLGYAAQTALQSYMKEFEKKAQAKKETYINLIEKSIKDIIKDEVNSHFPQILPKEVYDFATLLDKDLFESYGNTYSLKRERGDKDRDKDPPARSDQGSSQGTKSQPKSSGKSAQAEETLFEAADIEIPHNQGTDMDQTVDQSNVEAASKRDWFKKPKRHPTPDPN
ncbi:hypothetical protein Tco_0520826 [Tanacetum coccineum]